MKASATFIATRAPPDKPAVYTRSGLTANRVFTSVIMAFAAFMAASQVPLRELSEPTTM